MMTGFESGMGFGGWFWAIAGIGLMVTIVGLVIGALRDRSDPSQDPARILKARLARGEISPAQYEQARRQLGI